ncbi:MAG: FmdB family zinc ribbon protein [Actinomycetes bacterium]
MARYDYRCDRCGVFEIVRPVGTAPAHSYCSTCGTSAKRILSAPTLLSGGSPTARAVEACERSAHEPAVVGSPPPGARAARPANPQNATLPRP